MGKRSFWLAIFFAALFALPTSGCFVRSEPRRGGHVHQHDRGRNQVRVRSPDQRRGDRGNRRGHHRGRGNPHRDR